MKNKKYIFLFGFLFSVFFLGVGFFLGKIFFENKTIKKNTEIRLVKGETIIDTIFYPKPYKIVKNDTINNIITEYISDTIKLIETIDDYFCDKNYFLDFSTDTTGEFKVDLLVRENSLIYANSTITPMIKTIRETEYIENAKMFQFFISAGTSLKFNTQKLEFGSIIKNKYVIGVTGIRLKDNFNYTIDFGIKF